MAASKEDLSCWFDAGVDSGQRFMSIYCDQYDYEDYPVYAKDVEEFWKLYDDTFHSKDNMQDLMEVYDLSIDKESQMSEYRARHFPKRQSH